MSNLDLFGHKTEGSHNYLPYDGVVNYYGLLLEPDVATNAFNNLLNEINWQHDEAHIYGKKIITKRKVAWHGDKPFAYRYSGTTKLAKPWTPTLEVIKNLVQNASNENYNSCLLNLYHTGDEGMAWHSDAEKELKKEGAIASVSLGAARKFCFKHKKTKEVISVFLEHASLLIMKGKTQQHWMHRLPPTKKVSEPRINLTFRTINEK